MEYQEFKFVNTPTTNYNYYFHEWNKAVENNVSEIFYDVERDIYTIPFTSRRNEKPIPKPKKVNWKKEGF
jgi:hypothetical protein